MGTGWSSAGVAFAGCGLWLGQCRWGRLRTRRKWGGGACDCGVRPGAGCAERDGDDAVKGEGRIEGRRGGDWAWLACFGEIDTELLPILDCLSLNRHGLGCKL